MESLCQSAVGKRLRESGGSQRTGARLNDVVACVT